MELLARSQVGRDINRHHYTADEIEADCRRPVEQRLLGLIRLRNAHAAFQGQFELLASADAVLHLRWAHGGDWAELRVDFDTLAHELSHSTADGSRVAFAFS
jgi:sucrose phosphorylase